MQKIIQILKERHNIISKKSSLGSKILECENGDLFFGFNFFIFEISLFQKNNNFIYFV